MSVNPLSDVPDLKCHETLHPEVEFQGQRLWHLGFVCDLDIYASPANDQVLVFTVTGECVHVTDTFMDAVEWILTGL